MTKDEALKIAQRYAIQHGLHCDIVWYAGNRNGFHYVWLKNTSLPRYTGFGYAVRISPTGEIVEINSNIEIHEIATAAIKLHDGN
jgi:hypothetical protein